MRFSRRRFLEAFGVGIAAGTVPSSLRKMVQAQSKTLHRPPAHGTVLLNNNENGYGPSHWVQAQLQASLARANRYPVSGDALVARLAAIHQVLPERVLVGCGSTEIIRVLAARLLDTSKTMITASPTYEAMSECARIYGAQCVAVPLTHDFSHDLDLMISRVDPSTALIYVGAHQKTRFFGRAPSWIRGRRVRPRCLTRLYSSTHSLG